MIAPLLLSVGAAAVLQLVALKEAGITDPPAGLLFDSLVLFLAGIALMFATVWLADGPDERRARARAVIGEVERADKQFSVKRDA